MAVLAAALAFGFVPEQALAWGRVGHEAVAIIAQDQLSPKAREIIRGIIGADIGLDKISTCADVIKRGPVNCGGAFPLDMNEKSGAWHYVDISIQESTTTAIGKYCAEGNCIVDQIKANLKVLGDINANKRQKQEALMYVVHFVGDIHQPLHCADDNDRGGNDKPVYIKPPPKDLEPLDLKKMNLHSLWDNMIETEGDALNSAELALRLEKNIRDKDTKSWLISEDLITASAREGFQISKEIIYPAYRESGPNLGSDYQAKMRPVSYTQLEKAGLRLWALLEDALREQAPPVSRLVDGARHGQIPPAP